MTRRSFFVTMLHPPVLRFTLPPPPPPPHSLPSSEARPRLDFSDTFSQTFTRQLLLPPPPELPLPRSPIEYRAIVSVSQHLYLLCLRVASHYQKGSVVVISPPRLSQVATFDVATSHCLRLYAQAAAVVPKDSCACRLRDRGASSTEDGRTDGPADDIDHRRATTRGGAGSG